MRKKFLKMLLGDRVSMRYIRIPKDRVAVLIGHKGETKKQIETKGEIKLEIDSAEGEVAIDDHESSDPLVGIKIENIVRAIGRGFSPEKALVLFKDDMEFFLFDIHDYVGKKPTQIRRLKSRVIGRDGKTKRVIEELTGAHLCVYGHSIGLIVDLETLDVVKRAVDMLLTGSKHASVYKFIEREMKKLKLGGAW